MTDTVDIEITSGTTARAVLPTAGVEPVDLTADNGEPLQNRVSRFVQEVAAQSGEAVDVVYRSGESRRYLVAHPDGRVLARKDPAPATEPIVQHTLDPVTVSTDAIGRDPTPPTSEAPPLAYTDPTSRVSSTHRGSRPVTRPHAPEGFITPPVTASIGPARRGLRGRVNAALGLHLAPKGREVRLRSAASVITGPVPERAMIAVVNPKGGVGKTPITLGLAAELASHRGPGTVAAVDLGETSNSFVDRVAYPPSAGRDSIGLLDHTDDGRTEIHSGALSQYLVRQASGEDVLAGRPDVDYDLGYEQAATIGSLLSRHRDLLIVDTGNGALAGRWRWSITAATVVLVPIPLRADAASVARRTLPSIAATRQDGLASVIVVITDGPGDNPTVESDVVEGLVVNDGVGAVVRMPYEPTFASGARITLDNLNPDTRDALTALGATALRLMGERPMS